MLANRYSYFRVSPLTPDEQTRGRILAEVWSAIERGVSGDGTHQMVPMILDALGRPPCIANWTVWSWVYSFGDVPLIRRMTAEGARPFVPGIACRGNAKDALDSLLPFEHLTPDLQLFASSDNCKRTLVCFTGNDLRLNVPVQLFHLIAFGIFDQVIYLRDRQKQFFTKGMQGIAETFEDLCECIRDFAGRSGQLAVLGTSSGGYSAIRFAEKVRAERTLLLSPPMKFKGVPAIHGNGILDPSALRLVFSNDNDMDRKFWSEWSESRYLGCVEWVRVPSHATLWACIRSSRIDGLLSWLAGCDEREGVQHHLSVQSNGN